jgi:PAS domain S-box-containing protein
MNILAAFMDLSPDALVVANAAGNIVLVNAQVETMFGYRQEELVGQPVEMLLPERLHAVHVAHWVR